MAPANVVIKSDSWLNLSRSVDSHATRRGQGVEEEAGRQTRQELRNHPLKKRHSIDASYLDSNLFTNLSTGEVWPHQQQQQQQQHLLIRVRQRSYFNTRCSSSGSISSHLSQSIELNASESHLSQSTEPIRFPLLKRQPLKLTTLRENLKSTPSNLKHRQSPMVRSFSSLSERLSNKLSIFTSSWKQLLYEHRKGRRQTSPVEQVNKLPSVTPSLIVEKSRRQTPEEDLEPLRSGPLSNLHRRELTDNWVRRHQQRQPSVESTTQRLNENHNTSSRLCVRAKSLDTCSISSSSSSTASSLLRVVGQSGNKKHKWKRAEEQKIAAVEQSQRKDHSDTRSSSTLVSRSSSSASTLNSHHNNHQEVAKLPVNNHATAMTQPTSDYWSSSTTNTDYGARGNRGAQQVPFQIRREPVLAPDAEYYFQVAELERQRSDAAGLLEEEEEDGDFEDYAEPADESCLLDRSQVELVQMIGEGQKGYVFLGKLQSRDGRLIQDVAIKTLKYETEHLIEKLMREAHLMRQLEHPHIIRFIGVCPDTPALIAMELAELGEIKQYLKLNEHLIPPSHLVLFTFQISTALSYLESRRCVHRDVAARNVLVCSHNCVKLADFDLSRDLQPVSEDELTASGQQALNDRLLMSPASPTFGYYVATPQGKLPIRWLAPESLTMRRFTSASDVWMFAVCAWELFHYGSIRPWYNIRNNQVLSAIESGQRLARPPNCPERLYQLMLKCWAYSPDHRPRFKDIKLNLWSIYLKERARVQLDIEQRERIQHQKMLMQSKIIPPAPQCFIEDQSDFRQDSRGSPHHLQYSYSSNASGYSSNPIDHSNNSSRSSTLNSMMRDRFQSGASRGQPQVESQRFRTRATGHMLERQRSHGSIITRTEPVSDERHSRRIRDDQMLLQVNKHQQPPSRPISEMYTDARRVHEERLIGINSSRRTNVRARSIGSSSRPSSTCCAHLPTLEPSPRRETTYDGLNHDRAGARMQEQTKCIVEHHPRSDSAQRRHQQHSNSFNQSQVARASIVEQYRQPNASLTPNSLEEERQLAIHQRLLGHIRRPKTDNQQEHSHHRRSVNMVTQNRLTTGVSTATDGVDQSLEILESLISDRNFSKGSGRIKKSTNSSHNRGIINK